MPANSYNPFSSDFLRSGADDRLRPQGTLSYVAGATDDPLKFMYGARWPVPMIRTLSASGRARYRDASSDAAAVRHSVSASPSITASGSPLLRSSST